MATPQNENVGACSAAQPVHCYVYNRSASNRDRFFLLKRSVAFESLMRIDIKAFDMQISHAILCK